MLALLGVLASRAEMSAEDTTCGNAETDIATDRPDVTGFRQIECRKTNEPRRECCY
jgi:hypothetical protein